MFFQSIKTQCACLVLCLFATFGLSTHSSAQAVLSNSSTGSNAVALTYNIVGSANSEGGYTGYMGVTSAHWIITTQLNFDDPSATPDYISSIVNTVDANGNLSSTVKAVSTYYPLINGSLGNPRTVRVTFTMRQMANGSKYEGIWVTDYLTGAFVYATGMNRDGSPYLLPVTIGTTIINL